MKPTWTLSELAFMRHLLDKGRSASQIAKTMGVSKNVVLGAVWRGERSAQTWAATAVLFAPPTGVKLVERVVRGLGFVLMSDLQREGYMLYGMPRLQRHGFLDYALRDAQGKARAIVATDFQQPICGRDIGTLDIWQKNGDMAEVRPGWSPE